MLLGSSEFHFVWVSLGSQAMSCELTASRASRELQAKELGQIPSKMEPLLPWLVPSPWGTTPKSLSPSPQLHPACGGHQCGGGGCVCLMIPAGFARADRPEPSGCRVPGSGGGGVGRQAGRIWVDSLHLPEHPAVPPTCVPFRTRPFVHGVECGPGLGGPGDL